MKNMFTKKNKKVQEEKKDAVNKSKDPYTQGASEWNNVIYDMTSSKNSWKLVAFVSLFIATGSVAGITYIGSQSKIQPYIVEVDQLGQTYSYGKVGAGTINDERIFKALVGNFIINTRSVTTDPQIQRDNIFKVYALANGMATQTKLADWFNPGSRGETPFEKAQRGETTIVDIRSIIKISDTSWQVDWTEKVYDKSSTLLLSKEMRSVLEVVKENHEEDISTRDFLNNPLGIYVKDFRWTEKH